MIEQRLKSCFILCRFFLFVPAPCPSLFRICPFNWKGISLFSPTFKMFATSVFLPRTIITDNIMQYPTESIPLFVNAHTHIKSIVPIYIIKVIAYTGWPEKKQPPRNFLNNFETRWRSRTKF